MPKADEGSSRRIAERSIALVRDTHNLLPLRTNRIKPIIVNPHGDPLDDALRELGDLDGDDVMLLLLAIRPKSGAGTLSVPEEIQHLAKQHAHKTVAIAFGSPYILRELGEVSTFIGAWGPQPVMQVAAVRAVRGEIPMPGTLPVRIE